MPNRNEVLHGMGWMLASALFFTIETSLIKALGASWPAPSQLFWRQVAALIFLLPFIIRNPKSAFMTPRPGIMLFRSVTGVAGLILSIYAYSHLTLATANALSFTRPIWMAVLGMIILSERVTWGRAIAIVIGFCGVIVILDPSRMLIGHGLAELASIGAALLFAVSLISIKSLTRDHGSFVLLVYAVVIGIVLSAPLAMLNWRWPGAHDLALFAAMGVASLGTITCYIKGMASGAASAMASVDYVRLVFAILAGFAIFHELPHLNTLVGAATIILSVATIALSENRGRSNKG